MIILVLVGILAGGSAGAWAAARRLRKAFERTKELEGKVRAAEHLAEVGRLTGGLAHELKNPLSTLNLNLQLLAEEFKQPTTEAERRAVRKIEVLQEESRRLEDILAAFLRFAGRMELKRERLDAAELVRDLLNFYEPQAAARQITVRSTVVDGLPAIEGDGDLLKQALLNLILNAQAAMPEGGELMFRLRAEGGGVGISVTDTGGGIAAERVGKIFEAYYSTRPGGTGLGLPIVKRIVTEHGGTIAVSSEVGRGTEFKIWLPSASGTGEDGLDREIKE
jgi:signal transduction histidine kinase